MTRIISVLIQLGALLCTTVSVLGNPSRLTDCNRGLAVGDSYMNNAAIAGTSSKLTITTSSGATVATGDQWVASESYTATMNLDAGEQFVADFSSAATTSLSKRCNDTRVYQDSGGTETAVFSIPSGFTGNFTISLGYTASKSAPVKIVTATLVAPSAVEAPTLAPVDGLGLGSCAQCTKNQYNADCGAFSTEKNECDSTISDANCCASSSGDCCEPNAGMIAGVTVGAFVFVVLCCVGVYYASTMDGKNTGEYGQAQNQEEEIQMQATSGQNGDQKLAVTGEVVDNI